MQGGRGECIFLTITAQGGVGDSKEKIGRYHWRHFTPQWLVPVGLSHLGLDFIFSITCSSSWLTLVIISNLPLFVAHSQTGISVACNSKYKLTAVDVHSMHLMKGVMTLESLCWNCLWSATGLLFHFAAIGPSWLPQCSFYDHFLWLSKHAY